jgi:hypothetical protein
MRAVLALLLLVAHAPTTEESSLKKVDRKKVVGAPVLDAKAAEGIYVWLEDGWFNVAAIARGETKPMTVRLRSSKSLKDAEGEFTIKKSEGGLSFSASVGEIPVRSRFKTEGELTVNSSQPLFVGPLSEKAAATVSIGRY